MTEELEIFTLEIENVVGKRLAFNLLSRDEIISVLELQIYVLKEESDG